MMPFINETISCLKVGDRKRYIYQSCEECGKERWVAYEVKKQKPVYTKCHSCATKHPIRINPKNAKGAKQWKWNGGKTRSYGYIKVKLNNDSPFYSMADLYGYIPEHRYVMAKYLNRVLLKSEIVHHKNGIRDDNRLENLELTYGISQHIKEHSKGYQDGYDKGYNDSANKRIKELEDKIKTLEQIGGQKCLSV